MIRGLKFTTKGGSGSGHHGHAGRPGSIGGSAPGGVGSVSIGEVSEHIQQSINLLTRGSGLVGRRLPKERAEELIAWGEKQPKVSHELYRKVEISNIESFYNKHLAPEGPNHPIEIKELESWTADRSRVYSYGQGKGDSVLFTISGKNVPAVDISKYSGFPQEQEAINLYLTKLIIKSAEYVQALGWQLVLSSG